jgi:putative membrane protein
MTKTPFALAAALAISMGSFALAQQGQSSRTGNQSGAIGASERAAGSQQHQQMQQSEEKKFIEHVSSGNNFEIQLSQFVEQHSQDQQVKQLAQRLAQDHQQAEQQLKQVAQKMNVNLSDQLMPPQQAELQALQKKQGAELDRAFIFCNAGDHYKDVMIYSWAAKAAQDAQLKQYCEQTLPKLRQHLQQVDQVAEAVLGVNEAQTAGERIPGETNTGANTNRPGSTSGTQTPGSTSGTSGTSGSTSGTGIRSR